MRDGKPYIFMGANYWQGMNLGSSGEGGNRERLKRELDQMQKTGITNLRILALSEGPDGSPYRVRRVQMSLQ
jgi:mannan endo-1,4-beta-mannosidase